MLKFVGMATTSLLYLFWRRHETIYETVLYGLYSNRTNAGDPNFQYSLYKLKYDEIHFTLQRWNLMQIRLIAGLKSSGFRST